MQVTGWMSLSSWALRPYTRYDTPSNELDIVIDPTLHISYALSTSLLQANAYFQTVSTQGRAFRDENVSLKTDSARFKEEIEDLHSQVTRAEADALSSRKQLVSLARKKSSDANKVIDAYHRSEGFLKFMDEHDNEMRPFNMSVGWDKAINVVSNKHPSVVIPSDFPCPNWGAVDSNLATRASGSGTKVIPQASGFGSRGSRRPFGSGSKGRVTAASQDSSSSGSGGKKPMSVRKVGVIREPIPGKRTIWNEGSPTSSSSFGVEEAEVVDTVVQPMVVAESSSRSEEEGSGSESGKEESSEE